MNKKTHELSELIGLVYETAVDASVWPRLLEAMAVWVGQSSAQEMLSVLGPHFLRAHDLHQGLSEAESERDLLERVTNRLPLGMAVLSASGRVISINASMLGTLRSGSSLTLEGGRLTSRPAQVLSRALGETLKGRERAVRLLSSEGGNCTLWLSTLRTSAGEDEARVLVLAAPTSRPCLPEGGLRDLFGLTQAEARLTSQLSSGASLEDSARGLSISLNTAKTHLRHVFSKLGVRRQAELLQALYASPLWLTRDQADGGQAAFVKALPGQEARQRFLRLADGRQLSYLICGAQQGAAVVYMHGIAGSLTLRHPDEKVLQALGISLIVIERPGTGHSDAQPQRRIRDWPRDVLALADHLELSQFSVLGYSAGTPYALATACLLPQRVSRVVLAAAMPEISCNADLAQYAPTFRMSLMVARMAPSLTPALVRMMVKGIRRNVYRYMEEALAQGTPSDRQLFEDSRFRINYAQGLLAGVRQGENSVAQEVSLAVQPWGFDWTKQEVPVEIWHGAGDHLVALNGARKLAGQIQGCRLTVVPEAGHYIVYSHWREILSRLLPV